MDLGGTKAHTDDMPQEQLAIIISNICIEDSFPSITF